MSKLRKIKLSVPNPCSQDWDKMTPQEQGRFCSHCSKVITDFSNFTDRELVDYISKAKDKVCGRFNNFQLDRLIVATEPSNTPLFRKVLFGTALAAGVAGTVQGQNNLPDKSKTTQTPIDTNTHITSIHTLSELPAKDSGHIPTDTIKMLQHEKTITGPYTIGGITLTSDPDREYPSATNPDEYIFRKGDTPYW